MWSYGLAGLWAALVLPPNCSLDEIIMTYATGPDGHVTDVTSYGLRTVLNGIVTHRRVGNHNAGVVNHPDR